MRIAMFLLALCLGVTMAACRNTEDAAAPAETGAAAEVPETDGDPELRAFLSERKFILLTVNGAAQGQTQAPSLKFGKNLTMFGQVCNSFRGPGNLEGGILSLKNAASTKKACLDEELDILETMILRMLDHGAEMSVEAGGFSLTEGGDTLVFEPVADGD